MEFVAQTAIKLIPGMFSGFGGSESMDTPADAALPFALVILAVMDVGAKIEITDTTIEFQQSGYGQTVRRTFTGYGHEDVAKLDPAIYFTLKTIKELQGKLFRTEVIANENTQEDPTSFNPFDLKDLSHPALKPFEECTEDDYFDVISAMIEQGLKNLSDTYSKEGRHQPATQIYNTSLRVVRYLRDPMKPIPNDPYNEWKIPDYSEHPLYQSSKKHFEDSISKLRNLAKHCIDAKKHFVQQQPGPLEHDVSQIKSVVDSLRVRMNK